MLGFVTTGGEGVATSKIQSNLLKVNTQNSKIEWSVTGGGHLQESNTGDLFQEEVQDRWSRLGGGRTWRMDCK